MHRSQNAYQWLVESLKKRDNKALETWQATLLKDIHLSVNTKKTIST